MRLGRPAAGQPEARAHSLGDPAAPRPPPVAGPGPVHKQAHGPFDCWARQAIPVGEGGSTTTAKQRGSRHAGPSCQAAHSQRAGPSAGEAVLAHRQRTLPLTGVCLPALATSRTEPKGS